jgi:hypothetical protein
MHVRKEKTKMNKLETLINTVGNDLMGLAKAAIREYGFNEKWDSLPIEVRSYGFNEYLDMAFEDADGDYEIAFERLHQDSSKIFQTVTYFYSETNRIGEIEFIINENMISYLLASYGGIDSIMLEDYLYQSCLHEIGHMVDALKIFDGSKDKEAFTEYYSSLSEEYDKYHEWIKEQDPETLTAARARMEYYKIPYEHRANEYGHVNLDLLFKILQEMDKIDNDDKERE